MSEILLHEWSWYPSVLIGFGIWTAVYIIFVNFRPPKSVNGCQPTPGRQVFFHLGTLIGLLALVSPLDALGDEYLFSAHMIQHLLLIFLTAPFWLIGAPAWLVEIAPSTLKKLWSWLTRPLVAYLIFAASMSLWHIPALYNLTLQDENIHIFEHLSFIGAALIGWWPVIAARNTVAPPLAPPLRLLYLFLLGIPTTGLSAILTFASGPLYPFYSEAPRILGLSVLADQQLGGLLMWIPMHMIIFVVFIITFAQWFENSSRSVDSPETNPIF